MLLFTIVYDCIRLYTIVTDNDNDNDSGNDNDSDNDSDSELNNGVRIPPIT